uniref:(California timema) hypothetical protein n=1 Tax=Timema californicum TaxID=61474 RepID=A0A7R9JE98_TIMCA|nr:unnamed protein product [Timema californicum]
MQKDKLGYLATLGLGFFFQEKLSVELKKIALFAVSLDESLNKDFNQIMGENLDNSEDKKPIDAEEDASALQTEIDLEKKRLRQMYGSYEDYDEGTADYYDTTESYPGKW